MGYDQMQPELTMKHLYPRMLGALLVPAALLAASPALAQEGLKILSKNTPIELQDSEDKYHIVIPNNELQIEVEGPGKLILTIRANLPNKGDAEPLLLAVIQDSELLTSFEIPKQLSKKRYKKFAFTPSPPVPKTVDVPKGKHVYGFQVRQDEKYGASIMLEFQPGEAAANDAAGLPLIPMDSAPAASSNAGSDKPGGDSPPPPPEKKDPPPKIADTVKKPPEDDQTAMAGSDSVFKDDNSTSVSSRNEGPSLFEKPSTWGWITGGLGVGMLGMGVAFAVMTQSAQKELEDGKGKITYNEAKALQDTVKSRSVITNVGLFGGLALGATSAVLFIVGDPKPAPDLPGVSVPGSGGRLKLDFLPTANGFALGLGGRF
ncbi:MAG: hypothetical protein GMKNLPBB_00393 [Myxococcota bacterium]|nr:hypothetical protein [Myxococcota bacterium]